MGCGGGVRWDAFEGPWKEDEGSFCCVFCCFKAGFSRVLLGFFFVYLGFEFFWMESLRSFKVSLASLEGGRRREGIIGRCMMFLTHLLKKRRRWFCTFEESLPNLCLWEGSKAYLWPPRLASTERLTTKRVSDGFPHDVYATNSQRRWFTRQNLPHSKVILKDSSKRIIPKPSKTLGFLAILSPFKSPKATPVTRLPSLTSSPLQRTPGTFPAATAGPFRWHPPWMWLGGEENPQKSPVAAVV